MKRILIACGLLLAARNAFTQGLVLFYLRVSGTSHIYAPNPSSPSLSMIGQGPNDAVPSGTTDWSGWTPIGGNGLTGQYGAQSTFTSLLGAPGSNAAESTLLPGALGTALGGGTATTFRTGTAAGANARQTATFNNIAPDASIGSFEVVAWDNSSGLYSTWSLAEPAWESGLIAAGKSGEFNIKNVGGNMYPPAVLFPYNDDTTTQMRSFNLYFIPEPTMAALAALSAGLWLLGRHRSHARRVAALRE